MRIQAGLLVAILATASAFTVQPECRHSVHCPCGNTGKNVTVCADEVSIENPCSKWTGCRKCQDWLDGCLECLEGFEGHSCSQASAHREQSRQKRQYPVVGSNPASQEVSSYCRDPGVDRNGERIPAYSSRNRRGFRPGTVLEYFCNEDFDLEGEESIVCESRGQWSSPIPKCVAQRHATVSTEDIMCCNDPDPISNGKAKPSYPPNLRRSCTRSPDAYEEYPQGTLLKYSCEEEFRMEGPSDLHCTSSGSWTSDPPSCVKDCGYSAVLTSRRITYGTRTTIGEWPWVVAISKQNEGIICGGVLLTDKFILTAAHCLTRGTRYTLYFGKLHLIDADDDDYVDARVSNRFIIHPDYNNTSYDSDIALVEFTQRIDFTERVQPICLPTQQTSAKNLMTGNIGYVTGWGVTEKDLQAKELLLAELPFQSARDCMESLGAPLSPNMFCAGHEEGGQSACSGDSGSPLVYLNSDISRYTLEGLVSFGIDGQCGMPKRYTTFTKVLNFVPWISRNI